MSDDSALEGAGGSLVPEAVVHRLSLYPLTIPLRRQVVTAAFCHKTADPIVVVVELTNGTTGFGETVARAHLTGESVESVVEAARDVFMPALIDFHPTSFPEALELIEALPWRDRRQHLIPAARAGVELALLDAVLGAFGRNVGDVAQWMGLPGFGSPGSIRHVRFGGVLAEVDAQSVLRPLRRLYWRGVRAFKLEVGFGDDRARLARVAAYLSRAMARQRATLRIDARGRWSKDTAIEWLGDAAGIPLAAVEQPLAMDDEPDVPVLRDLFDVPIVFDESLKTVEDGHRLIERGVADGFDVGIAKCGGLMPSLRLAALARRHDLAVQLGSAPGETGILSAAGLRFLEVCPGVVWAEGQGFPPVVRGDVVSRPPPYGYGGRPPRGRGGRWGDGVEARLLEQYREGDPVVLNL
jgi:muconate cycloisomerase